MATVHGWPQCSSVPNHTINAPAVASRTAPHVASELNGPINVADVKDALPLLNNGRSGAAQGWPAEFLRYAYEEQECEDGSVSKQFVLLPALAAVFDAAFQRGVLPSAVEVFPCHPSLQKGR